MSKTFCLMAVALAAAGLDAVTVEPVGGNATPPGVPFVNAPCALDPVIRNNNSVEFGGN